MDSNYYARSGSEARSIGLSRIGLTLCVMTLALSCGASAGDQGDANKIPVPEWVEDSRVLELTDGRLQVSFVTDDPYPNSRAYDFYSNWAFEHRWARIPKETDPWVSDEWVSYEDMRGLSTDQRTAHWRSPDGDESLLLALLHKGDRETQEVYVILAPYSDPRLSPQQGIGPGDSDSGEDFADQSLDLQPIAPSAVLECPQGTFVDAVSAYAPLPPGGYVRDHCEQPPQDTLLSVSIEPDGRLSSFRLIDSSGCDFADDLIRRCLSEWMFQPASCDGEPVRVERALFMAWDDRQLMTPEADPCKASGGPGL